MPLEFQLICTESFSKTKIKNELNLLHLLISNGELWHNPVIRKTKILDSERSIKCFVSNISSNSSSNSNEQISFLIKIQGPYESLAPLRLKLLEFLFERNFKKNYVIKDDISKEIACKLYPLINELENQLRGYLIYFFVTKFGVKWWDLSADNEMKTKAIKRKNNEKVYSKYIENKAYLIDFGELGKMIYSLSSGFIEKGDIINRVLDLEETPDAIKQLKEEIQGNYIKYFKETFKNKGFQSKWETLEKIRHKVAHSNLFINEDLEKGKKLYFDLKTIIDDASKTIEDISISTEEKEQFADFSLGEYSELFSIFIKTWKLFERELIILSRNYISAKMPKGPPIGRIILKELKEKDLISEESYGDMISLISFRNELIHSQNFEFEYTEYQLKGSIHDLKYELREIKYGR